MVARQWRVGAILLGLLQVGATRAQSPQEKQRSDILNELDLKKKPPAPQAPPPAVAEPESGEGDGDGKQHEAPGSGKPKSGRPSEKPVMCSPET